MVFSPLILSVWLDPYWGIMYFLLFLPLFELSFGESSAESQIFTLFWLHIRPNL